MNRHWSAGLAAGVLIATVALTFRSRAEPAAPPSTVSAPGGEATRTLVGNSSCSARGCHGRLEPVTGQRVGQNEFPSWALHDKHSHAYEVLQGARAARMAENLAPTNPGLKAIPAYEDSRCLACHATPQLASEVKSALREERLADGVGCESCHGSAGGAADWLHAHCGAGWASLSPDEKKKNGMTPLGELDVQAYTCAGCHVGASAKNGFPARDLNHDLMAAGHPRLTFELGSFRVNMPPHWRADKDRTDSAYEARVWSVGQVESARASMDLLAERAENAGKENHPWPEFAEADCFACHADLRPRKDDWRAARNYDGARKPGTIPYSSWYTTTLSTFPRSEAAVAACEKVRTAMSVPYPNASFVARAARDASASLNELSGGLKKASFDRPAVAKLLVGLANHSAKPQPLGWDEATQIALGVAALRETARSQRAPKENKPLDQLFRILAFPEGYESPQSFRREPGILEEYLKQLRPVQNP